MTNKLDRSGIAETIKGRIRQIEEQLKQHQNLSDELERLRRALSRLEGEVRSRVNGGRRGRQPAARSARSTTPKAPASSRSTTSSQSAASSPSTASSGSTASSRSTASRAPRGQNKAKILESLKSGPKTASEIAKQTGISTGTASATLTKMAKAGEIVKAERGYALP